MFICDHSIYNESIWDNIYSYGEYSKKFAYLMGEINHDFVELFGDLKRKVDKERDLGRIGEDLVECALVSCRSANICWDTGEALRLDNALIRCL